MSPEIEKLKELDRFYKGFFYPGFTIKALSKTFGVSHTTVSKWFSGKLEPRKEHMKNIRRFLLKKQMESARQTKKWERHLV